MSKNQLFKIIPNKDFIINFCKLYTINNIDSNQTFTINKLKQIDLLNKINIEELQKYYIKCKSKKFLTNLTYKKSITILRQLLKLINYNVQSKERCEHSKKYLEYSIIKLNHRPLSPKSINDKLTVSFK